MLDRQEQETESLLMSIFVFPQDCLPGLQVVWAVRVLSGLEDALEMVFLALL